MAELILIPCKQKWWRLTIQVFFQDAALVQTKSLQDCDLIREILLAFGLQNLSLFQEMNQIRFHSLYISKKNCQLLSHRFCYLQSLQLRKLFPELIDLCKMLLGQQHRQAPFLLVAQKYLTLFRKPQCRLLCQPPKKTTQGLLSVLHQLLLQRASCLFGGKSWYDYSWPPSDKQISQLVKLRVPSKDRYRSREVLALDLIERVSLRPNPFSLRATNGYFRLGYLFNLHQLIMIEKQSRKESLFNMNIENAKACLEDFKKCFLDQEHISEQNNSFISQNKYGYLFLSFLFTRPVAIILNVTILCSAVVLMVLYSLNPISDVNGGLIILNTQQQWKFIIGSIICCVIAIMYTFHFSYYLLKSTKNRNLRSKFFLIKGVQENYFTKTQVQSYISQNKNQNFASLLQILFPNQQITDWNFKNFQIRLKQQLKNFTIQNKQSLEFYFKAKLQRDITPISSITYQNSKMKKKDPKVVQKQFFQTHNVIGIFQCAYLYQKLFQYLRANKFKIQQNSIQLGITKKKNRPWFILEIQVQNNQHTDHLFSLIEAWSLSPSADQQNPSFTVVSNKNNITFYCWSLIRFLFSIFCLVAIFFITAAVLTQPDINQGLKCDLYQGLAYSKNLNSAQLICFCKQNLSSIFKQQFRVCLAQLKQIFNFRQLYLVAFIIVLVQIFLYRILTANNYKGEKKYSKFVTFLYAMCILLLWLLVPNIICSNLLREKIYTLGLNSYNIGIGSFMSTAWIYNYNSFVMLSVLRVFFLMVSLISMNFYQYKCRVYLGEQNLEIFMGYQLSSFGLTMFLCPYYPLVLVYWVVPNLIFFYCYKRTELSKKIFWIKNVSFFMEKLIQKLHNKSRNKQNHLNLTIQIMSFFPCLCPFSLIIFIANNEGYQNKERLFSIPAIFLFLQIVMLIVSILPKTKQLLRQLIIVQSNTFIDRTEIDISQSDLYYNL